MHQSGKATFDCVVCGNAFESANSLRFHSYFHMEKGIKQKSDSEDPPGALGHSILCELCGKEFATQDSLRNHIKSVHGEPVKCPECPKMFRSKYFLQGEFPKNQWCYFFPVFSPFGICTK